MELLYSLEGRTGESTIRDSLTVMGDLTVEGGITLDAGAVICGDLDPCEDDTHDIGDAGPVDPKRWNDLNMTGDISLGTDSELSWDDGPQLTVPVPNQIQLEASSPVDGFKLTIYSETLPTGQILTFDTTVSGEVGINVDSVVAAAGVDLVLRAPAVADPTGVETARFTGTRSFVQTSANGAQWIRGQNTEEVIINAFETDSLTNLLPANAIIEAVVGRVTVDLLRNGIAATSWNLSDTVTNARFMDANVNVTAGSVGTGVNHWKGNVTTEAAGPTQSAAAAVRIRVNAIAGATYSGAVRVTVFYRQFVAPTS